MVRVQDFVRLCLAQEGKEYRFGAEADPGDPDPRAFDCSELIQWACDRLGVRPPMPDGAWWQYRHCARHGLAITVSRALETTGALLFRLKGPEGGNHVAVSLGNGLTIEARSRKLGVGRFSARGRAWTHAALIPGLDYGKKEVA